MNKVLDRINMITPQKAPLFRDEMHKIRHLGLVVLLAPWDELIISQFSTSHISFNRLVISLRESLQIVDELEYLTNHTNFQKYDRISRQKPGQNVYPRNVPP